VLPVQTWLFFNSLSGSLTIATTQAKSLYNVNANNNARITSVGFTDNVTMVTNSTLQLAAMCAAASTATTMESVSCIVEGLLSWHYIFVMYLYIVHLQFVKIYFKKKIRLIKMAEKKNKETEIQRKWWYNIQFSHACEKIWPLIWLCE